jgi:hypothetical protein
MIALAIIFHVRMDSPSPIVIFSLLNKIFHSYWDGTDVFPRIRADVRLQLDLSMS